MGKPDGANDKVGRDYVVEFSTRFVVRRVKQRGTKYALAIFISLLALTDNKMLRMARMIDIEYAGVIHAFPFD